MTVWCDSDLGDEVGAGRQASDFTEEDQGEAFEEAGDGTTVPDYGMLVATDDAMAVQNGEGRRHRQTQTLEITVDSEAVEVVAPPMLATEYKIRPSAGSRSGAKYWTTSGNGITMRTEGGYMKSMTVQMGGIAKPSAPACRTMSGGHRIVLEKGNVLDMKMKFMPPGE